MSIRLKAGIFALALLGAALLAGCGGDAAVPAGQDSSTQIEQQNGPAPGEPMSNAPAGPGG